MNDNQVPGDPPLLPHGSLQPITGGLSFDGTETSLIGKLPSSACIVDPDKCLSGFALSAKLRFDELSLTSNAPQYVMDTGASNNGKGVSVYVQLNSLYFKVATSNAVYQASFIQVWMFLCQGLPLPRSPLVQSPLWPLAGFVRVSLRPFTELPTSCLTYLPTYQLTYQHTFCLSTYLPTYLPTCLPNYLPSHIPTYLPTYIPTYLPAYLTIYLRTYLPTYPAYLPTYISTYIHTYIPTYLPTNLPTYTPIYPSTYLPNFSLTLSTYLFSLPTGPLLTFLVKLTS